MNHRIIAALIPHATPHIVRGGGHLALLESAQQVGPLIAGFLQDDRAASDAAAAQPSWRR